ncbi:MAG: hypothetical protein FWH11_13740 [Micrococcales bacterium]|nr:hypothetical protein [Micrococcales bacterium]
MRARAIFRESWRNFASGASGSVGVVLVLSVVGGVLGCLDASAVGTAHQEVQQYLSSAADTRVVISTGRVSPSACDSLSARADTTGSGALRDSGSTRLPAAPGLSISTYEVSAGFVSLVLTKGDQTGMVMSAELAGRLGYQTGDLVETSSGPVRLSGVFDWPDDGRDARLHYALLVSSESVPAFDECWARIEPGHGQAYYDELLSATLLATLDAGSNVQLGQVNNTHGKDLSPSALVNDRVTKLAWLAALLGGACIGVFAVWQRRLSLSSNLHAGARRADLLATVLVEDLFCVVSSGMVATGSAAAVLAFSPFADELAELLVRSVLVTGWCLLGFVIGSLAYAATTRESQLFRLFKSR